MRDDFREGARPVVLWPDFDALNAESLLWWPGGDGGSEDRASLVRSAVAHALSPKQREVVEAYFFEGLSQGDIAKKLGVTQQVVHKRIYGVCRNGKQIGGAIRKLRAALEPHFAGQQR